MDTERKNYATSKAIGKNTAKKLVREISELIFDHSQKEWIYGTPRHRTWKQIIMSLHCEMGKTNRSETIAHLKQWFPEERRDEYQTFLNWYDRLANPPKYTKGTLRWIKRKLEEQEQPPPIEFVEAPPAPKPKKKLLKKKALKLLPKLPLWKDAKVKIGKVTMTKAKREAAPEINVNELIHKLTRSKDSVKAQPTSYQKSLLNKGFKWTDPELKRTLEAFWFPKGSGYIVLDLDVKSKTHPKGNKILAKKILKGYHKEIQNIEGLLICFITTSGGIKLAVKTRALDIKADQIPVPEYFHKINDKWDAGGSNNLQYIPKHCIGAVLGKRKGDFCTPQIEKAQKPKEENKATPSKATPHLYYARGYKITDDQFAKRIGYTRFNELVQFLNEHWKQSTPLFIKPFHNTWKRTLNAVNNQGHYGERFGNTTKLELVPVKRGRPTTQTQQQ